MGPSSFFQHHVAVIHAVNASGECALAFYRLARHDFCQPPREPAIVRFVPQWSIQPRRRDFERVLVAQLLLSELILDVQQRTQVMADALAVIDADRFFRCFDAAGVRPVDHDAQNHPDGLPAELHIEDLEPVAARHTLGGVLQPRQFFNSWRVCCPEKQKVGKRPTVGTPLASTTTQYTRTGSRAKALRYVLFRLKPSSR